MNNQVWQYYDYDDNIIGLAFYNTRETKIQSFQYNLKNNNLLNKYEIKLTKLKLKTKNLFILQLGVQLYKMWGL